MQECKEPKLSHSMTLFDVVCLGVNGIIGAGIFLLPGKLALVSGQFSIVVFVICGLLCLAIALCFAEMGGIYQETGGAYIYARNTFGPMVGFMVGWMMWLSAIIGWAAMARGLILYLRFFSPSLSGGWIGEIIVIGLILGLGTLNFLGVKIGARVINLFTIGKMIPIFVFVTVGFLHIETSSLDQIFSFEGYDIGAAIVIALFAYTGFEYLPVPAGEMKRPGRDIPIAFFITILGATLVYALVQTVTIGTLPGLAQSEKPLADAATIFLGSTGGVLIAIGALLAIAGVNSGIALTGPRTLFALSSDGFFPDIFRKIHPKYHTPYIAIGVNALLTLVLTLTGTFEYLIFASVLVSVLQYIPTCLAVIVLRRRRLDISRSYTVPGGYIIPCLAIITCIWILFQTKMVVVFATFGGIVLSLPIYFLRKKKTRLIDN
ncbi:MAG: amino acid permease [Candidatus Brocadiaceae bacterium]|nr:amino acid permease [Candidatus Brocadiaceae bacterium]